MTIGKLPAVESRTARVSGGNEQQCGDGKADKQRETSENVGYSWKAFHLISFGERSEVAATVSDGGGIARLAPRGDARNAKIVAMSATVVPRISVRTNGWIENVMGWAVSPQRPKASEGGA